jgi:anthranilate/para-aminobenzoate synthase component I
VEWKTHRVASFPEYPRQPLVVTELAASQPPAAVAEVLATRPGFCWLDSGDAATGWSYLSCEPRLELAWTAGLLTVWDATGATRTQGMALSDFLEALLPGGVGGTCREAEAALPPFRGGWICGISYELAHWLEPAIPRPAELSAPGLRLAWHPEWLAYDQAERRWFHLRDVTTPSQLPSWLNQAPIRSETPAWQPPTCVVKAGMAPNAYLSAVTEIQKHIAAGDIYQANFTQQFEAAWPFGGYALYRRLRSASPAPYGLFWDWGRSGAIASVSPELLMSVQAGRIETRPIKGTRPRGKTVAADEFLKNELLLSAKDHAELAMIIDLERNDLGRICEYGGVRVASAGDLETHPTVHHRVARVEGQLRDNVSLRDLLRATFPGGSVTGAPKLKAMEILRRYEAVPRGLYCGALGWLGHAGSLAWNLPIRTTWVDPVREKAYYHAGGGIVADSVPEAEFLETLAKARAFFEAVNGSLDATK